MIYEDEMIYVEREEHEVPWVKVFTKAKFKELSDCDEATLAHLWRAVLQCEKSLREFYTPDKINIASFANYVPRVHFHVQARFKNDSFFPESVWGKKMRNGKLDLPEFREFAEVLAANLKMEFR
ncbi:HIT family protein [uncultured Campylobacter sp.]|uniref:HIT family protein n=1 Tax=uncultured Campylobacter sp. TaxID=218934 RepID=UPI002605051F|nr:HIT family protein [uncultured Campylobacter sp.]